MRSFSEKEVNGEIYAITEREEDVPIAEFLSTSFQKEFYFELFETARRSENVANFFTDSVNLELHQDKVIISLLYPPDEDNPPPVSEISYEELKELMNDWNERLQEWKKTKIVEKSPQTFFESVKDWFFG